MVQYPHDDQPSAGTAEHLARNNVALSASPPVPSAVLINELLDMIVRGEIKLPMFQRGFVWSHEQIRNLLDSIYQGYPIGSLLLWETHECLPEEVDLGGFQLPPTPELRPRSYVLDGQQRLVSLYGAVRTPQNSQIDKFPVYFDLRRLEFTHDGGGDYPHRLELSALSGIPAFMSAVNSLRLLPDGDQLVESAEDLMERFQRYKVSVITIHEEDMTKVAPIFERINSTATRLTLFDFMVAALWTPNFNFKQHVASLREALEPKKFDGIDEVTIIRALATVVTGSAKRDTIVTDLRQRERGQLSEDIAKTREALERAVDFLATDVSVVEDDVLPYERQLVLLAYVLSRNPVLTPQQTRVLRRWFWTTCFSERYRRGGEGLFDEDLAAAFASLDDPDQLQRFGTPPTSAAIVNADFRTGSALTKAFVAMLASKKPSNLRNGRPIDVIQALSPYNRRQFHHIFPKAFLVQMEEEQPHWNSLANICMLSAEDNKAIGARPPSDYFAEFGQTHSEEFIQILQSNLIPDTCMPFIRSDDFEGFLRERAEHIKAHIAQLIYS